VSVLRRFATPLQSSSNGYPTFVETRQTNPDRTEITDSVTSDWLATLTDDCRTVPHLGQERTFTEQIEVNDTPTDDFNRTLTDRWGNSKHSGRWCVRTGVATDYYVTPEVVSGVGYGWGNMKLNTVGSSRRIAPSSYGYNYDHSDTTVRCKTDTLSTGHNEDQYLGIMFGYQGSSDH